MNDEALDPLCETSSIATGKLEDAVPTSGFPKVTQEIGSKVGTKVPPRSHFKVVLKIVISKCSKVICDISAFSALLMESGYVISHCEPV